MKRVVASVLLFAGTLIFLWVTFGIGENLELRGAPAWAHFLRANITWPPAVRFLWRLYVGVSLTMMPNVLSLTALTMFGAVLGRLGWSPFGVVLFTYLLVLLNLPDDLRFDNLGRPDRPQHPRPLDFSYVVLELSCLVASRVLFK